MADVISVFISLGLCFFLFIGALVQQKCGAHFASILSPFCLHGDMILQLKSSQHGRLRGDGRDAPSLLSWRNMLATKKRILVVGERAADWETIATVVADDEPSAKVARDGEIHDQDALKR